MATANNLSPAVTLPTTTATHVLGDTNVVLAEGDLCLYVIAPEADWEESSVDPQERDTEEKPILTLTVGKAAFPLYRSTVFGTLDGDERVYLFSPKLGAPGG